MRLLAKLVIGVLVLALLVGLAATIAIRHYLPPEKLRGLIISNAQKSLRRQVRLRGVSVGLVRGLSAEGLEISEKPDFSAGTFAAMERFSLSLRWLPLLSHRVEIDKVSIDGLRLKVVKLKDGSFNFSDLTASAPAPAPVQKASFAPETGGSSFVLAVHRAALSDGRIDYEDRADGGRVQLSGVSAKIKDFRLDGPFSADVSLKSSGRLGGRPVDGAASFSGTVDLAGGDAKKQSATVRKLQVDYGDLKLAASGKVQGLSKAQVDLKLSVGRKDGGTWLDAAVEGGGALPPAEPSFKGSFSAKTDGVKAKELAALGVSAPMDVPPGNVSGTLDWSGDAARIDGLKVKTDLGKIEASGSVAGLRTGRYAPDLQFSLDVDLPPTKAGKLPVSGLPPDLLVPAIKASAQGRLKTDEVELRAMDATVGKSQLSAKGVVSGLHAPAMSVNLAVESKNLALEELGSLSPATRDFKLSGGAFFAIEAAGKLPRPVLQGKLQLKDFAASVSGLNFSGFSGTASFNEKRIDIPNLRGKVADGNLDLNLTVKDYVRAPDIDLEASLDQLDLGKLMAAKQAQAAKAPPAPSGPASDSAGSGGSSNKTPEKSAPMSARGKLTVGKLIHPNIQAQELKLSWALTGITPDQRQLGGWARVHSSGGSLHYLGDLATQSKLVKVLISPLLVIQKVGSIGGIRLFPDFNNVNYSEIAGDYALKDGLMTLRESRLNSSAGDVTAAGTIDLPGDRVNLNVVAQVANIPPIEVAVTGTTEDPKTRVKVEKLLGEPAKKLLQDAGKQLLDGLFKR